MNLGSSNGSMSVDIISDYRGLVALQPEWDALWSSTSGPSYHQSSTFALVAWQEIHNGRRSALRCIVVRQFGKAVLIWALFIRRAGLVKILCPLYAAGIEYTEPLVYDGPDVLNIVSTAWLSARSRITADIINLPQVKAGSCVHTIVSKERPAHVDTSTCYVLKWDKSWTDWDTYFQTISAGHDLAETRRRKRRLSEQGNIEFQILDGSRDSAALIDWCLHHKRDWAEKGDRRVSWIYSEKYRNFLVALFSSQTAAQNFVFFLLTIDGSPIAVKLAAYNKAKLDGILSAFDATWGKYSPGSLLDDYCMRWTFERSLEIDFGVGTEPYKRFWSHNNAILTASYRFSASPLGAIALEAWKSRQRWRAIRKRMEKRSKSFRPQTA